MVFRLRARKRTIGSVALWSLLLAAGVPARPAAQAPMAHTMPMPEQKSWAWSWDANLLVGFNYQLRKFTDFDTVESQNWLMGGGERQLGRNNHVRLHSMLSFEPFTIQALGSPQVFQTGETYQQAPLVDYQHPHDLIMDLGATWARPTTGGRMFAEVAAVGPPALGPPVFMHRPSASEDPTVPLGHHQMDATHITHGIATFGVQQGAITAEGSWFRGAEPDENRANLEMGPLDSASGRLSWRRRGWDAQVSAAHLTIPEWVEPFSDMTRLSASVGFTAPDGKIATLAVWGQNREIHGILDSYLVEATFRPRARHAWYTRAELTTKDILNAGGRHPRGFTHFHQLSRVGAVTGGYVFELSRSRAGQFGIGGDVTVYYVPSNLLDNYGAPASFHLFLHYTSGRMPAHDMH
jgi:hypothetical protein